MSEIGDFMRAVFEWKDPSHYILVWRLEGKLSSWFADVDEAIDYVEANKAQDIYVGVGLAPEDFGPHRRCEAAKIVAMVGLALDVDFQSAVHKKSKLLPREDARRVLDSMPAPPSLVVDTGHGFHGWWLFKEPWEFSSERDRAALMRIAEDWNACARRIAEDMGGTMDSTFDLARVMRVPGTTNLKADPVEAHLVDANPWRAAGLEDFLEALSLAPPVWPQGPKPEDVALFKDSRAAPPTDKFAALAANDKRFLDSYRHLRKDLEDDSPSAYDMSLASIAAQAGWTAQEICDLLIASRRDTGCDLKFEHKSYYERTVALAMRSTESMSARREIGRMEPGDEGALDKISKALGVHIERVVHYWADPPIFCIYIDGNLIRLEHGVLTNQRKLREVIEERCLVRFNLMKAPDWDVVARLLLGAAETYSLGRENTEIGAAADWVREYLRSCKPVLGMEESVHTRYPFQEDGTAYIYLDALVKWVDATRRQRVSAKSMGTALRGLGAEPLVKAVQLGDVRTSRYVWRLPALSTMGDEALERLRAIYGGGDGE